VLISSSMPFCWVLRITSSFSTALLWINLWRLLDENWRPLLTLGRLFFHLSPEFLSHIVSCDINNSKNPIPLHKDLTTFSNPSKRIDALGVDVIQIDHLPSLVPCMFRCVLNCISLLIVRWK
jgi:hypothetical protein